MTWGREKVEDAVIKTIIENQDNNKQTGLGEVGSRLVSLYPDFDVRSYGYSILSKFLEEFDKNTAGETWTCSVGYIKRESGEKRNVDQLVRNLVKSAGEAGELSAIGNRVYEKYKDFKISDYGYSQFNQYVKSMTHVKLEQEGTMLESSI